MIDTKEHQREYRVDWMADSLSPHPTAPARSVYLTICQYYYSYGICRPWILNTARGFNFQAVRQTGAYVYSPLL